jgi:hypothetical protein
MIALATLAAAALQPPSAGIQRSASGSISSRSSSSSNSMAGPVHVMTPVTMERRALTFGIASALLTFGLPTQADDSMPGLFERKDTQNAYQLSYPTDWSESGKPVKTHLHELLLAGPGAGRQKLGVTIDPVKIDSLEQFGSLAQTTERVIGVEQTRDGVKQVTLRSNAAEVAEGKPTYYTIDYVTESSRGTKIFCCKYCIANRKLYVLQAQCNADAYDADAQVRATLKGIVDSFEVLA